MANDPYYNNTVLLLHADTPGDPLWQWCEFADDFTSTFAKKPANTAWNTAGTYAVAYGKNTVTGGYNTLAMSGSTESTPFTIELDVYIPSFSQDVNPWFEIANYLSPYNSTPDFSLWTNTNGTLGGVFHGTTVANITTLATGRWYHVSVSYNGATVCNVHIDGTLVGTYTVWTYGPGAYLNMNYVGYTSVGRSNRQGDAYYANLRVYRGSGAYKYGPSNYSVVAPPPFLPLFSDSSPAGKQPSYTGASTTAIYTTDYKFGGGCIRLDGASRLTIPTATDLDLGASDWTIEFWAKANSTANGGLLHRGYYDSGTTNWTGLAFSIRKMSGATVRFYFYGVSAATEQYVDVANCLPVGSWVHVAMVRRANTGYIYVNGVLSGTLASLNTPAASTQTLRLGVWDYSAANEYFDGFMDDIRITKGVARYAADFTPPAAAFGDGQAVISGTVRDSNGVLCSRRVNVHSRATGRLLGAVDSDAITGAFSIGAAEDCYAVVLDSTGAYNALVLDRLTPG